MFYSIISSFISTVIINKITIQNQKISNMALVFMTSTLFVNYTSFMNITAENFTTKPYFLQAIDESKISFDNSNLYNNIVSLFLIRNSEFDMFNCTITGVTSSYDYVGAFDDNMRIIFKELSIDSSQGKGFEQALIYIKKTVLLSIEKSNFEQLNLSALFIENANGTVVNSNFTNSRKGMIIRDRSSIDIHDSIFTNLDSTSMDLLKDGGALVIEDSNSIINATSFSNNTANNGGAIIYSCQKSSF
jgi:hypothetical protein